MNVGQHQDPDIGTPWVVSVEDVWKRYSRTLRKGTRYAVQDGARTFLGFGPPRNDMLRPEEFWSLQKVSFRLAQGESLGLIGRNGAGKTTVLRVLTGVVAPDRGCSKVRGRIVALMMVGAGFHPMLSGRENVFIYGSILGMKRSELEARLEQIVAFAELSDFIDTPVKYYSSGMYMRLAFSVAAFSDPQIFIVDEVLAVGDQAFREKCVDHLLLMKQRGCSLVVVSHAAGYLRRLADRGLWLERGETAASGPIDDVLDRYHAMLEMRSASVSYPLPGEQAGASVAITESTVAVPDPSATLPVPVPGTAGGLAIRVDDMLVEGMICLRTRTRTRLHITGLSPRAVEETRVLVTLESRDAVVVCGCRLPMPPTTYPQPAAGDLLQLEITATLHGRPDSDVHRLRVRIEDDSGQALCEAIHECQIVESEAGEGSTPPVGHAALLASEESPDGCPEYTEGIGYADLRARASIAPHFGPDEGTLRVIAVTLDGSDPDMRRLFQAGLGPRLAMDMGLPLAPVPFGSGESCVATLDLVVDKPLADAVITLSFRQPRGGRSAGMRFRQAKLDPGGYRVRFCFPLLLARGDYLLGTMIQGKGPENEIVDVSHPDFARVQVVGPMTASADVLVEVLGIEEDDPVGADSSSPSDTKNAQFRLLTFRLNGAEAPARARLEPDLPAEFELTTEALVPIPKPAFKFSFLGPKDHAVSRLADLHRAFPLKPVPAGTIRRYRIKIRPHLAGGRYVAQAALMSVEGHTPRVTDRRPSAIEVLVPAVGLPFEGTSQGSLWIETIYYADLKRATP